MKTIKNEINSYSFNESVKLFIARLLNFFMPNKYCWAGLVMWALGYGTLAEKKSEYDVNNCKNNPEYQTNGSCYCGKFTEGELTK